MTSARLTIDDRARFEIKIVADGTHDTPTVNFFDAHEKNIVLHLVARMREDRLVLNTCLAGQWAAERVIPHEWVPGAELTLRLTLSGARASLHAAGMEFPEIELPGGVKASDIKSIGLYGSLTIRRIGGMFVELDGVTNVASLDGAERQHAPPVTAAVLPDAGSNVWQEIKYFSRPAPEFEEFSPLPDGMARRVKILAYYLPQFHAFPENDAWWGKGFTEWTNLVRGTPRFKSHYQPRVPRDLGFYNLDSSETLRRHAEFARAGGIHGFIFYYYWFNGKRLMEKPLDALLADASIDVPFALMWANENWTRRWDGFNEDVLISQDYRQADEAALVADYARHFRDPRYIRLADNRPLLVIYRPGIIPDAAGTLARWREMFQRDHGENPIFLMAQGFGDTDPTRYGFDGAIEFPPHKIAADLPRRNAELAMLDPEFIGDVFSYDDVVARSLREAAPHFPLIRGVMPAWDNDARRQGSGMVIHGSTPAKYQEWLEKIIDRAQENPCFGEKLVVIGAWNEWAEGNYLEPDVHFGAAYLNATGRAAAGIGASTRGAARLLMIGADAHSDLLLRIAGSLRRKFGIEPEFLLLEGGRLESQYAALGNTQVARSPEERRTLLAALAERGVGQALVVGAAGAVVVRQAHQCGIACVQLIDELPRVIQDRKLEPMIRESLRFAKSVVFPAGFVRDAVLDAVQPPRIAAKILVHPPGVYQPLARSQEAARRVRGELGMAPGEQLVIGAGHGDLSQGFDLFVQLWRQAQRAPGVKIHFCWLGAVDEWLIQWLGQELDDAQASGSFHLLPAPADLAAYVSAAATLALTAREAAFPALALQALSAGTEVVAFQDAGGLPDVLAEHGLGASVPYANVPAMLGAVLKSIGRKAESVRKARQEMIAQKFGWDDYITDLLNLVRPDLAFVSAVIPNYNYARYLPMRMASVFAQAYPLREVLVLDDGSTDQSLEVIEHVARDQKRDIMLMAGELNSGSVFAQWRKAAQLAKGEFVWIAEADDLSDPEFVPTLIQALQRDARIVFAFSDSRAIDTEGVATGDSYKSYYATEEVGALARSEIFRAPDFAQRLLSVRNLILNVSAVVWRRDALLRALEECGSDLDSYRLAGDWRLYLQALAAPEAKVAYEARPLNTHRRHPSSVTHSLNAARHVAEIGRIHTLARQKFDLEAGIIARQQAYLDEVAAQLAQQTAPRKKTVER